MQVGLKIGTSLYENSERKLFDESCNCIDSAVQLLITK